MDLKSKDFYDYSKYRISKIVQRNTKHIVQCIIHNSKHTPSE